MDAIWLWLEIAETTRKIYIAFSDVDLRLLQISPANEKAAKRGRIYPITKHTVSDILRKDINQQASP